MSLKQDLKSDSEKYQKMLGEGRSEEELNELKALTITHVVRPFLKDLLAYYQVRNLHTTPEEADEIGQKITAELKKAFEKS
jgi:hypothetical protein